MGAVSHHRRLFDLFIAILRTEFRPAVAEPHRPENHFEYGHGYGTKVRAGHLSGPYSRQLSAVQYTAGQRAGQQYIHHSVGRYVFRYRSRPRLHAVHRYHWRDLPAGGVLQARAGYRRQNHLYHQNGDGTDGATFLAAE